MELSPHVLKFFAILEEAGAPPLNELSYDEARQGYRRMSEMFGGPTIDMAHVEDFVAEGPVGPIPLRQYRPDGLPDADAPALIYLHGGGGVIGDLESHDKVCRQLACRAQCAVMAVDYRLAPEHPAPAPSNDVISAFRWIVANASTLGIDQDRIAVGGDSAGGCLSAVVAIAARDEGIPLRCQILIYPGLDLRESVWDYPSRVRNGNVPPLTLEAMRYFVDSYLNDVSVADDWRVSPIVAGDMAGLCPALVILAGFDPLLDEGGLYADRLEAAGVAVTRHVFPSMIHGFIELGGILPETDEALDMIAQTLRQRLDCGT
ncbi:alpha/beta hydrolase [Croceicoccus sediminis]|uniref:alpha/beta hydrolase n=1 Tax=Croceicoccus sediminis TaxID=2571150 RepID=UPI0011842F84|nr:alpha/beta hydrolase [Croceicoccus sediminis]